MNSISDYELRVNAALGKILRYFNFLEINLGRSISRLENKEEPTKSYPDLAQTGFNKKLEKFKTLLEEKKVIKKQEKFNAWYQEADEARRYRNFYVHGTWQPLLSGKDVQLEFHLAPWRKETLRGESIIKMSLDELESDAQKIEEVFEDFRKLRHKYNV